MESDCASSAPSDTDDARDVGMSRDYNEVETRNTRRRAKRQRASDSPPIPISSLPASYASTAAAGVAAGIAQIKKSLPTQKHIVIGQSTTCPMKAAKNLNLPKTVYKIGNIDSRSTVEHMMDYLNKIGVHVISCFDRTPLLSRFADNKTFRVCIANADKAKLLRPDNWASGISIQKWIFKTKDNELDNGITLNGAISHLAPPSDGAMSEGTEGRVKRGGGASAVSGGVVSASDAGGVVRSDSVSVVMVSS